ncbi:MAG TPA: nuclear transport factor 2 family protein [Candidatus Acidoferrum sp.]|nr:nuclear transport factor 2 family protein [Candidatus Acidoferrum sp.]
MKKLVVVLILAAAALTAAERRNQEAKEGSSTTKQALMDLENTWVEALVKADAVALDAVLVDSYVDTDENSQRSDKKGVLAVIQSGDLKLKSIKISDMRVYDYGDAAVVTGSAAQAGTYKGQAVTAKIIFTDTFVRRNGKWKAVASHRSPA